MHPHGNLFSSSLLSPKHQQKHWLHKAPVNPAVTVGQLNFEPFKSSEFPRVRVNGEAEDQTPRLFSFLSKAFRDLGHQTQVEESALISPENRISATGPRKFVCNSQILCLTEKFGLTELTDLESETVLSRSSFKSPTQPVYSVLRFGAKLLKFIDKVIHVFVPC
jgi:hypothetical protein